MKISTSNPFSPALRTRSAAGIGIFLLSLLTLTHATAESAGPPEPKGQCDVRIASGPQGGVYVQLVRDIQALCSKSVSVCAVPSTGGLQNLMLLATSEADVGLAQLDTLQEMSKGGEENIRALQALMPLHSNLLHVLTRAAGSRVGSSTVAGTVVPFSGTHKVLRKFSDLKGASVALVGTAQLLGQTLENQLRYGMQFLVADSDAHAIKLLDANQVQAIFTLGGWPYPSVEKHDGNSGLMLADFDLPAQSPFVITKRNYPKLGAYNFNFLAAPNLLLTRPFKPQGPAGKRIAQLQSCLLTQLDVLQEGRYHRAWQEIKSPLDTLGVSRFSSLEATKTKSP